MQLPPDLDRDVEKLVGMVWSLKILFGCGDLLIVKELHRYFILLLRLWNGCDLFDPSATSRATNNVRTTQEGAAACRRHCLEVEDEGLRISL
jgi:hypothetical protein